MIRRLTGKTDAHVVVGATRATTRASRRRIRPPRGDDDWRVWNARHVFINLHVVFFVSICVSYVRNSRVDTQTFADLQFFVSSIFLIRRFFFKCLDGVAIAITTHGGVVNRSFALLTLLFCCSRGDRRRRRRRACLFVFVFVCISVRTARTPIVGARADVRGCVVDWGI